MLDWEPLLVADCEQGLTLLMYKFMRMQSGGPDSQGSTV